MTYHIRELAHTVHFMNLNPTQRQIKKMKEEVTL
jgi:hypothetical protein